MDSSIKNNSQSLGLAVSAAEKIRTFTAFRPLPPQSSASTSFATAAEGCEFITDSWIFRISII
jgi:hypothetical protein